MPVDLLALDQKLLPLRARFSFSASQRGASPCPDQASPALESALRVPSEEIGETSDTPKESTIDWKPYITADPEIMHGAVCFRGTRIPVSVVLDNLAAGENPERILNQFPSLKAEHIPASIACAAELARVGEIRIRFRARPRPGRE